MSPEEPTEEELGYTAEYAAWKEAVIWGYGAAGDDVGAITPDFHDPIGGGDYPASHSLSFTIYHQKTSSWCLPAVGQSIAHHRWGGFNSPTIEDKQGDIATDMRTTSSGTDHTNALAWMNERFANHNESWRYTNYKSDSLLDFKVHAMHDIYIGNLPMYVRVNLYSGYYKWSSSTPGTAHATLLTGWSDDGATARSADPYARPKSGGGCTVTWDSGHADLGCIWGGGGGFTMSDYFLARDIDTGHGKPEWV